MEETMHCPICQQEVEPVKIGATIGGTQLAGCPLCGVVVWAVQKDNPQKK